MLHFHLHFHTSFSFIFKHALISSIHLFLSLFDSILWSCVVFLSYLVSFKWLFHLSLSEPSIKIPFLSSHCFSVSISRCFNYSSPSGSHPQVYFTSHVPCISLRTWANIFLPFCWFFPSSLPFLHHPFNPSALGNMYFFCKTGCSINNFALSFCFL